MSFVVISNRQRTRRTRTQRINIYIACTADRPNNRLIKRHTLCRRQRIVRLKLYATSIREYEDVTV